MKTTATVALCLACWLPAGGQVTSERLLHPEREPQNWLTYAGSYRSWRYSTLDQIKADNAKNLELTWVYQLESLDKFEATPLVVDGVMYFTQPPSDVIAVDARTGRAFWTYRYRLSGNVGVCCGRDNRGLAILGDTLFLAGLDGALVALDAKTGKETWKTQVADPSLGYSFTMAPLVVKDKVIVGPAGGEYGIRGFLAAFDAATGKEVWRFNTVPGPGEPGHDTWTADTWQKGGGSIWLTGSYDPEQNLIIQGVGNPGPDWNHTARPGDNLYASSVIALDADTGKLKWHYQFIPNDAWDWDAMQTPVLIDAEWQGQPRKLIYWAHRDGLFYVLDRTNGKVLSGTPFVKQNWWEGFDANGRPRISPKALPTTAGTLVYPGVQGGTNWYAPSYSPRTGLFYFSVWADYYSIFQEGALDYSPGRRYNGGNVRQPLAYNRNITLSPDETQGYGAVDALDPKTGKTIWQVKFADLTEGGVLTTAGDVLFTGNREGYFDAFDARNGRLLWKASLGGYLAAGPITYSVDGKQYVAIAAGHGMYVFGLRD
ncbi:MAG TPA: PQQ-dependent dehydrogenase, methanol/ethanol family [Bryobacteraceae bacterium]|nr:PQQ-dependent dehydrogenase, methanol/ethanol family [Bryobacteraceae bacterium]